MDTCTSSIKLCLTSDPRFDTSKYSIFWLPKDGNKFSMYVIKFLLGPSTRISDDFNSLTKLYKSQEILCNATTDLPVPGPPWIIKPWFRGNSIKPYCDGSIVWIISAISPVFFESNLGEMDFLFSVPPLVCGGDFITIDVLWTFFPKNMSLKYENNTGIDYMNANTEFTAIVPVLVEESLNSSLILP